MSLRRLSIYFLPVILAAILVGFPTKSQFFRPKNQAATQQETILIAGRNVNMVSGTQLPGGDPWLQRQNEPSVAVSTRNPLHLLAGANDYRTVDIPASEGELPGQAQGAMAGDAWVGLYKSFDGGESWVTTLVPGFPQDKSAEEMASPLKQFSTAADPIVRAGTNGLFYYSGMGFNRSQMKGGGSVFVARYIDNNNAEGGDPIKYLDTKVIDLGTSGQFIDMPRIAVDIPRGSGTVSIDGQTIPRSNIYCAYTVFLGNLDQNIRSRIVFRRSTDCGATWSSAIKISESQHIIQGAIIAIDPNSGAVYVAYRRFLHPSQTNSIVIVKSADFGQTFSSPTVIANINPFDQPVTDSGGDGGSDPLGTSFRTNSYPTMAIDNSGIVYVAWAERGRGPAGAARIVMATSQGGSGWTAPALVESAQESSHQGHQFMPYLTFVAGKLMMVWYDQRNSVGANTYNFDNWVSDGMPVRQTVDIRAAQTAPGILPSFEPSIQVSRYYFILKKEGDAYTAEQAQFNPPNYPLFKGGTVPFHGDYVEMTPSPLFVLGPNGWRFNTDPSTTPAPPVFHVVWTDNRDVLPPDASNNYDWTNYTPPASNQGDYGNKTSCLPNTVGMRNQNIYTSRLTSEVVVAAPGNAKSLGTALGNDADGRQIRRAFAIYIKNTTDVAKNLNLQIISWPSSGGASFLEFETLHALDVQAAPYSTIARTVFVWSPNNYDTAKVEVFEGNTSLGVIVLNPDPTNPAPGSGLGVQEIHNPNIVNSGIVNWANPNIVNPNIVNPNIVNPNIVNYANPNIVNPNIVNPNIVNPNIVNPNIVNPNIVNPNIVNPNIVNPNIVNPNIVNPNIVNVTPGELASAAVKDVVCTVKNAGNTVSAYTLKTFSKEAFPEGIYLQLLVYKISTTPSGGVDITGDNCKLKEERHHDLLLNVTNPNIVNPNIVNPNIVNPNIVNAAIENATFSLAPNEEATVNLRVIEVNPTATKMLATGQVFSLQTFVDSIGFAATAHAVNTADAKLGNYTPPAAASKLVIGTASLPDGVVGKTYSATLNAYGGTAPYGWSLNSGELPLGLILGSGGVISGTVSQTSPPGFYHFILRVDDWSVPRQFDTQQYSIYIDSDSTPDTLTITTASLPSGVLGFYYGATLEAIGGVWPRTWKLTSGSLPPGLMLDSGGVITGTVQKEKGQEYPTTYNFSVVVTDKNGTPTLPKNLSIEINLWTGDYVTISGTVYSSGGNPLDGVVMRGLPNTPITGANGTPGYYEDTVPYLWSGTVIPFKAGHTFSPSSRTYTSLGSSQSSQDYNLGYASHTISGTVLYGSTGLEGVVMSGLPGNPPTNGDGFYTATVTYGWSGTVTPALTGYTFTPPSQAYTDVTSNQTRNYTAALVVSPASKLVFTQSPNGGVGGAPWTVQPKVEVQNAAGDRITTDNSTQVTLTIKNNPGNGSLSGLASLQVSAGVASFSGLSINKGGYNYTLEATSTGLTLATSELFSIEGFSSRANMSIAREFHTATYLFTDKILVAGGENPTSGFLNTAELYDPATKVFEVLTMKNLRGEHTATPLLDGRVLITGGGGNTSTAELFDPTSKTFSWTTGTMNYARMDHRATRLQDGRVLITGGIDPSGDKAELYDPTLGTFSPTGSMSENRYWHTSTWLPNGKVLITGGKPWGGAPSATAELYDPSTGTFSSIGSMNSARYYHVATLLNNGTVLITGGNNGASNLDSAEIFNPADNSFTQISSMKYVHAAHQALLLRDGTVLIFGAGQAEIYDPATLSFRLTGEFAKGVDEGVRQDCAAAETADGLVFVSGGGHNYSGLPVATTEMWNPLVPFPTHVISGHVTQSGAGVSGVLMGGLPGYPVTDPAGYYEGVVLSGLSGWSGTVTPMKAGYTFNPTSIPYTNVTSDLPNQNYSTTVGPPQKLAFSQQPSNATGGATIIPAVTVEIQDAAGNLVTTATNTVTLSLLNAGGATLSGTKSKAAVGGIATFNDLSVDKVGTGYKLRANSGSLTGVDSNAFSITAGAAGKIVVETKADGTGTVVPSQNIIVGSSITVYAITRDAGGNFIENAAAESWSLVTKSGGVVDGDLVPAGDKKSAVFTGLGLGSAQIRATKSGLTFIESGLLTVVEPYEFVLKCGSQGTGDGQFNLPFGIAIEGDKYVYAADSSNHRIQKFTYNGGFVGKWGSQGTGDGQFDSPSGVTVDNSGHVYVLDTYNHRVQKFTSDGVFLLKWGSQGSGNGQFQSPTLGIAAWGDYIYVTDTVNSRIQKFTINGIFVTQWGGLGTGNGQFNWPYGIAVDSSGYVYVSDSYNNRIQKFTSDGSLVAKWGTLGTGDGQFNGPRGIAVDNLGYVYVADNSNRRIQKFNSSGVFILKWGSPGTGDGQFAGTWGIVVDSSGYVYVADPGNYRIQKFRKR